MRCLYVFIYMYVCVLAVYIHVYTVIYIHIHINIYIHELPWCLDGKESACSVGDLGSIPGLGRPPREGNGNPLQYSCLENLVDRGAWQATVHGVTELNTTEQLTLSLSHSQLTML